MKRKAQQRRGHPVKVRYQPRNAGARWMVFWSGGGYSYFPTRVPPLWVLSCICGVDGFKYNDYMEWSVTKK